MSHELKHVLVYTDGACEPNPGPGGYGIIFNYNGNRKELSGGFTLTTNNRMEIYAAIKALETLKEPCRVTLYSDSQYLVRAMMAGWARRWKENGWWRTKQERAANVDLWKTLLSLCEIHTVEFVWVKGHAGHPENERCDELSVAALRQENLAADEGYEGTPISEQTQRSESGKIKITYEGQPCRKCSTPVVKRVPRKPKKRQLYYYSYYLWCPSCGAMYMLDEAKYTIDEETAAQLEITKAGQPCRRCSTPLIERVSKKRNHFLYCPKCEATYELKAGNETGTNQPTLL